MESSRARSFGMAELVMKELTAERLLPFGALAAALAVCVLLSAIGVGPPASDNFLAVMASLGGVFTGFVATMRSLLHAMGPRTKKRLRESGYRADLRHYASCALWGAVSLCVISVAGFFCADTTSFVRRVAAMFVVAIAAFALTSLVRLAVVTDRLLDGD